MKHSYLRSAFHLPKALIVRLFIIFFLGFGVGCRKNDNLNIQDGTISFRELSDDLVGCNLQNLESNEFPLLITINNENELENFISCGKVRGSVDFNSEFILAGRVSTPNLSWLESQRLEAKDNKIIFTVDVGMGSATQPFTVQFFAVLPIEYRDLEIELITLINGES